MESTNDDKTIVVRGGLNKTPPDARDFKLGAVIPQLDIREVPDEDFRVGRPLGIKNQLDTDFCTAFASCAISELQEGVKLNPAYQFAKIKQIEGSFEGWGANLRSAAKSLTSYGSIEEGRGYKVGERERDFLANWVNWVEFDTEAEKHRKRSYFSVDGRYTHADNIRVALWQFRHEHRAILAGTTWRPSWTYSPNGIISNQLDEGGFGHAIAIIGQKMIEGEPYLMVENSYGESVGNKGFHYFPREVVNREFAPFGAFMCLDMPPEEVKKKVWTLRMRITEWMRNYKICKPSHVS